MCIIAANQITNWECSQVIVLMCKQSVSVLDSDEMVVWAGRYFALFC